MSTEITAQQGRWSLIVEPAAGYYIVVTVPVTVPGVG